MNPVESAGLTDIGRKRRINQDAFFLDDRSGLFVVADGMGGHKAGEVASRMVVDTLQASMTDPETFGETPPEDASLSKPANRLMAAIRLANQKVYRASLKNEAHRGMGSTVSAIFISGDTIIGANVGDSPIYLIHQHHIDEISVPHTLAAKQAAEDPDGDIHDAAAHHILTQAIGTRETVTPHICEIQGFRGDILVISSDGLSNKVTPDEINAVVTSMSPDRACRHLVALANDRGGEDNITMIIARIGSATFKNSPVVKPLFHLFRRLFAGFRNKR